MGMTITEKILAKHAGRDAVNEVSYLLLDVIDEMHILQPSNNIQLSRENPESPEVDLTSFSSGSRDRDQAAGSTAWPKPMSPIRW